LAISRRTFILGSAATVGGAALGLDLAASAVSAAAAAPGELGVTLIAVENGPGPINDTGARWGVYGADLGHMFRFRNRIYMTFGDTLGAPAADQFWSVPHQDWRSNTMAWIPLPQHPEKGLKFGGMITDRPGHAKELLSSQKVNGVEQTVIPTYGVAVGDRMFLHHMSVKEWGAPGHWTLNYSGLAYSDDEGQTWTKDQAARWPGDSNFGQVAFVESREHLYVFGIPGGRYGGIQLARVEPKQILDLGEWEYWDGSRWQRDIAKAATIVPAPAGELSVQWNSHYRRWIMMYLDDPAYRIVLRTAERLTGPWDAARVVVTGQEQPQLYAPYITPLWNDTAAIYFTMSLFGPYHVALMRTSL
jgi:Domain of unknown function (DUF4185)